MILQLEDLGEHCKLPAGHSPVFEKTWSATQKNVKSHVFLDFEKNVKKRKKTYVVSQAT